MADLLGTIEGLISAIVQNPVYLLLTVSLIALFALGLVLQRIHKIHTETIFVHQAWGSKWKGR